MSRFRNALIAGALALLSWSPGPAGAATVPVTPTEAIFNPSFIPGGGNSGYQVTLSGPAPSGFTLTLQKSSLPEFASVMQIPTSVTVPAGATSVSVPVTTTTVTAIAPIIVTATANGVTKSDQANVYPTTTALAAPNLLAPKAGQTLKVGNSVTFDWADVPGAVGYWIQMDNVPTFNTSLTLTSNPAASQYFWGTPRYYDSDIATTTGVRYWRVAARDAAGRWGPWSTTRTFTSVTK